MKLFCKHDWKVLDKHVRPGLLTVSLEAMKHNRPIEAGKCPSRDAVMIVLSCPKCGAVKKIIEEDL